MVGTVVRVIALCAVSHVLMPAVALAGTLKWVEVDAVVAPDGQARVSERHFLSGIGEAGKRVFSGGCADCHGQEGLGGDGPRLDTKAFARDHRRSRDLHQAVNLPIPAHEELGVVLGPVGSARRFNDVEKLGKYLREMNVSRRNKSGG